VPWGFLGADALNDSKSAATVFLGISIQNLFVASFARQTDAMTFADNG